MKTITGSDVSSFEGSLGTEMFKFRQLNSSVDGVCNNGRSAFGMG
jgi:hypothetical protein